MAKEEAEHKTAKKWHQYDKYFKKRNEENLHPSPSVVLEQLESIIWGVDQTPFLPKLQIKGKGREEGTTFPPRTRHKVPKEDEKSFVNPKI